jgi:enoyl-CoA hydratase/carnithine racemase
MSSERVTLERDGHVAVVTLSRPSKHNALDPEMFDAITSVLVTLEREPGLRSVVLRGDGPSFCSGLDLAAMAASGGLAALSAPLLDPPPNRFQQVAVGWLNLPVPVIAAIHGNCFGGGLQIALATDIRIATPDARLSVMETRWGLIPDMGITRTLPRLVGIDVAKELTYTARVFSGEQAAEHGLVTRVAAEPFAEALALAHEIAQRSPDAVRRAKQLFDLGWTGAPQETLALEARLQSELIGTRNQLAAVTAGVSSVPAEFEDPS